MTVISPPSTMPIRRIQWTLKQPGQVNRSGWTGRRQVVGLPGGAIWSASVEFAAIKGEANARPWRSFFAQLQGQINTFPLVACEGAQHTGSNPTIVSGSAGATMITVSAAVTALKAGAMMTVKLSDGSYQLVMLTADFTTTTPTFLPALRLAAATGAGSLETILPYAHVALSQDSFQWSVDLGLAYGFSFNADEAF